MADKAVDRIEIDPSGSTWKALEPSFGQRLATDLTREDCREHYTLRQQRGKSDSTIRRELEMLRAALRFKYGSSAPSIWMPPPSKPRERHLTKADVNTLLEHVETPHVRLFIILALTTGARMSAILDLKWDRVFLDEGYIDLNPGGRHETNKRRAVIPVNERAMLALVEAKAGALTDYVIEYGGGPILSIKKAIIAAGSRSGVQCSPHTFRHSAAVWMAQANVPMQKIAQFLGHTSTRVTERTYARYSPTFMKDAADALEF